MWHGLAKPDTLQQFGFLALASLGKPKQAYQRVQLWAMEW